MKENYLKYFLVVFSHMRLVAAVAAGFTRWTRTGQHRTAARLMLTACAVAAVVVLAGTRSAIAYAPDLAVAIRQTSVATAFTGDTVRYEVTLRNIGQAASITGDVQIDLPLSFTSPSAAGPPFTCTLTTGTGINGISCRSGLLGIGQARMFTFSVTAPRTITGSRQVFTLTAKANPNALGLEGAATANNTATVSTAVETVGDLQATWSGSPISAVASMDVTYRATLKNTGDRAVPGSVLRISIPLGQVSFVRFENNGFSGGCGQPGAQGQFSCQMSSLAAGASVGVGIVTRMNPLLLAGDLLLFQATADTVETVSFPATGGKVSVPLRQIAPVERNKGNNSASLVTTITYTPVDLVVTLVRSSIINTCGALDYPCFCPEFRVDNRGPGTYIGGTQLRIDKAGPCSADSHLERGSCVPGPDPSGCQSTGSDQTTCSVGNLSAGSGRTFSLCVSIPREGTVIAAGVPHSVSVTATVDPAGTIPETNEQNNSVTITHSF